MNKLRRDFNRFLFRNRNKGIPNLMLYIGIGNLIVYFFSRYDGGLQMYNWFCFSADKILRGQVWRLFTYIFTFGYEYSSGFFGFFLMLVAIYFYYWIGKTLEANWGTLRFNLFYLTGLLMMDIAALALHLVFSVEGMDLPLPVTVTYLNLSMFLAVATLIPEQKVLFMMFIPIKMKWLALVDLGLTAYQVVNGIYIAIIYWTKYHSAAIGVFYILIALFPLIALLNYFLFLGKDIKNLLPQRWQRSRRERKAARNFQSKVDAEPNPDWAKNYRSSTGERPYRHKCTVCGRTDTDYPNLEFRYCSKCKGYYCYCIDHINNHVHIQ